MTTFSGSAPAGTPNKDEADSASPTQMVEISPDGVLILEADMFTSRASNRFIPMKMSGDSCSSAGFVTTNFKMRDVAASSLFP